jgi:DNA polymerase III sliding clamp (beta) subunit (PCNA family)
MGGRMTKVVFETATIADAIKKADRIAPTKGTAFDKAAGIVLTLDPASKIVVVRATDLSVYSMEWVHALAMEGEPAEWRLPSKLFAGVLGGLPIGTGKNLELEEKNDGRNRFVQLTAGKTRAKFNIMQVDYYPVWDVFSPDGLVEVEDFGGRISMVEWAAAKTDDPPLNGINFDGKEILSCDRYRLAVSKLEIPGFTEPVTIPSGVLSQVLKQTGAVSLGVSGDGHLLVMPDDTTQIKTVMFGKEYPNVAGIRRPIQTHHAKVKKAAILEIMQRASAFAGNDRFPILRLFLGREEIAVIMNSTEVGTLADVMEVPGYCDHERFETKFTPKNIIEAIEAVPNDDFVFGYDPTNSMSIVHIDGGSGYEAWVMPRKDMTAAEREEVKNAKE